MEIPPLQRPPLIHLKSNPRHGFARKVAVVTGAAAGIGRARARQLAAKGAHGPMSGSRISTCGR